MGGEGVRAEREREREGERECDHMLFSMRTAYSTYHIYCIPGLYFLLE